MHEAIRAGMFDFVPPPLAAGQGGVVTKLKIHTAEMLVSQEIRAREAKQLRVSLGRAPSFGLPHEVEIYALPDRSCVMASLALRKHRPTLDERTLTESCWPKPRQMT